MFEFNNRMTAQRKILSLINKRKYNEELLGLSHAAIKRWMDNNNLSKNDELVKLVLLAAQRLFFLANKSQEQITNEYMTLKITINDLIKKIESVVNSNLIY